MSRKQPHEVFTPRSAHVNESMYIERPDLERALRQAVTGGRHILIHGESGSGKSWLYKRVLNQLGATYLTANLANASRLGSIQEEFQNLLDREERLSIREHRESKGTSGGIPGIVSGTLDVDKTYAVGRKEPFEGCLRRIADAARNGIRVLVMDNLEAIFSNEKLMKELGDLLILLDDDRYAQYGVRILIVGVPSDVRDYFARIDNTSTIGNRIVEIPEVARLSEVQTRDFVARGFLRELGYVAEDGDLEPIKQHVVHITDRIPQSIHEYCLELAFLAQEGGGVLSRELLAKADEQWLLSCLSRFYASIEAQMNERETKIGRRNQTLYSLGLVESDAFRAPDLAEILRAEFPRSTASVTTLNLGQILGLLADGDKPILKRSSKADSFLFADPRYRMTLRAMLRKDAVTEGVTKVDFSKL